jgi:hypothetical protein
MATAKTVPRPASSLYDEDFHLWTQEQAQALRDLAALRWNGPLDLEHLAEEGEDLGRSVKHAVRSQLTRLIVHCLKLAYSPAAPPRELWLDTIDHARAEIEDLLTRSIRREVEQDMPKLYGRARREVERALRKHRETVALPSSCPFTLDQLIEDGWYPEPLTLPAERP